MTSQEMMRTNCYDGHFENIAPLGEMPNWVLCKYPIESVNPNHHTIFGYEEKAFLRRQYHAAEMQADAFGERC
jgi:hypothetical protein